jgi:hypothetical protein
MYNVKCYFKIKKENFMKFNRVCILLCVLLTPFFLFAQKDTVETGFSVSPSTLRFNAKPGAIQVKTVKINNDTRRTKKFQVGVADFGELGDDGKIKGVATADFKYGLAKWISVSPSYIEVGPRETKTITITLDVPNDDKAAISAWTTITIDQVIDRKPLEIPNGTNGMGFGVNPGFGFSVFVFQNPPNVINNQVEITSLKFDPKTQQQPNRISMDIKNSGDGIGFCNYYVEISSLNTGKTEKVNVKRLTILPGYKRKLKFDVPGHFAAGSYSAVSVLDFGSKDELQTAEVEFQLK